MLFGKSLSRINLKAAHSHRGDTEIIGQRNISCLPSFEAGRYRVLFSSPVYVLYGVAVFRSFESTGRPATCVVTVTARIWSC